MQTIPQPTYGCNGHVAPVIPQGPATLPEAPCSITLRVPMPGYADQALITGRGQSGAEAAAQWQSARDGLLAVLAPPPTPSREERLSQLLACGLRRATTQEDYSLVERLTKAYILVLRGLVEPTAVAGVYAVRSNTSVETWYEVSHTTCTCQDYVKRHTPEKSYRCKHIWSLLMYTRLDEREEPRR